MNPWPFVTAAYAVTLIGEPRIPEGAQLSRIDVVIRLRAED